MSDNTPFDCRANHKATFDDISPLLLEDYLRKTGSKLAKQVRERGVEKILEDMQLLEGPPEMRYIQNVALMMFCEYPEKFFRYTYVQMTSFPKVSIENPSISEDYPNITGSVPQMIQATMERFRNLFIREKVIKVPNQIEAVRVFNYPYQAIEEAVVRAMRIRIPIHPVFLENVDKSNGKMLESVSNETSLKQVLKQDEYKKLKPIIEKLEQDKSITIQEAMKLTGKSRSTAWRYMQLLVDYDVVKPFGNTNTSTYEVIDDKK